jgi:nicotinamidase-related amidase
MAGKCLLIVDVQRGFINQWTAHVPAAVEALQRDFERVVVTRFYNPEGSLYRRLIGWQRLAKESADFPLAFTPPTDAPVIDKATYTCVTRDFLETLAGWGVEEVHVCGIATDNCVLKCAVDLFEAGIAPVVMAKACGSHGGPACHDAGLLLLRRFVGEKQVVN